MKTIVSVLAVALAPSLAFGALYSENFEVDPTASWTVNNSGATDAAADFNFDYSTVGIASAPNGSGTRGMKLQANLTTGAFGGFSVSPTGQSFGTDYKVSFDVWSNYNGPLQFGGSGSTNISMYGVGTSGTSPNSPGSADGVWFATTGDGGSSADWRVYSPAKPASHPTGDPVYLDPAGSRNHTGALYQVFGGNAAPAAQLTLFPQQSGTTRFGTAGMTWHRVVIRKIGNTVTWEMDGTFLANVDISAMTLGGDNILFGHSDINNSSSSDPNAPALLFTLVDNIEVVPEPTSLALMGFAGLALLRRRRA